MKFDSFKTSSASSATSVSSAVIGVFDTERLRRETFIAEVECHTELDSTNNRALALAANANSATPFLVLAERQTAGRGRGANAWWSAPGSLTFSLLFDAATIGVPLDRWPQVSLAAALAIRQTVADVLPGDDVRVKWPNDVFLRGKKVAGILVEIPPVRPQRLVLGIGLNVNNSFAAAPDELRSIATSMIDAVSSPFTLNEVLLQLLQTLHGELTHLQQHPPNLANRWRPHCLLKGRTVHVAAGPVTHVGVCRGIDQSGALLLETESGRQRLLSGVVSRFEYGRQ